MPFRSLLPENLPEHLKPLVHKVDALQQICDECWPRLMLLQKQYRSEPSEATKAEMQTAIKHAERAHVELDAALRTLATAMGVNKDSLIVDSEIIGDPFPTLSRASIMAAAVEPDAFVEDYLTQAVEMIERHAPPGWLAQESEELFRLSEAIDGEPISVVKGIRLESVRPPGHRLRQAVTLARDFLNLGARYDHFGGALAVTQLAQLGRNLDSLACVRGSKDRIDALFKEPDADATMFELLVASACAAKGRDMEFVGRSHRKTPDLRCRDTFNMVVECKRSMPLTDYEVREEKRMRELFRLLRTAALARGQYGVFELIFTVEIRSLNLSDIAASCLRQWLTVNPERRLEYPWGSVAYRELAHRGYLAENTKAYSPYMLEQVFSWDLEMPDWDGFICKIDGPAGVFLDHVASPVGMAWRVDVEAAIIKRSRAPMELFATALSQVPAGESGIVYLAYHEGARADMADNRTEAFIQRIQQWEHDAKISVPATFLVRQFAIPRGHGNPDMIENTVRFRSPSGGGEEWVFRDYPANIFTNPG